jgi:spore maturation protein CgeB
MKILKVTTFYSSYLKDFYENHLQLKGESYLEQKELLDHDAFGWSDFWEKGLAPLGYEVMEIVANAEPLQKCWAKENGIIFDSETWQWQIVYGQIKKFQPTILFLEDYSILPSALLDELKQNCSSIQLVFSWCGAPYDDASVFKAHDIVLSCIPEMVETFRTLGHRSEHINHAFDPRVLDRLDLKVQPTIDFSFVGQIVRSNQYHLKREQLLESLVEQVPIYICSPSSSTSWKGKVKLSLQTMLYQIAQGSVKTGIPVSSLAKLPKIGNYTTSESKPQALVSPQLRPHLHPAVFGLDMFQTLRNSKVALNCHIDISPRSASNMRLFEATGVGTCLITDWKENLTQLFEPGLEIVTYRSAEECAEKVRWLLEHPKERDAIAQAGQVRTLKNHTFARRSIQLDKIIKRELSLKS